MTDEVHLHTGKFNAIKYPFEEEECLLVFDGGDVIIEATYESVKHISAEDFIGKNIKLYGTVVTGEGSIGEGIWHITKIEGLTPDDFDGRDISSM